MKKRTLKNRVAALLVFMVLPLTIFGLTGCSRGNSSSVVNDQKATNNQLDVYQKNQPVPQHTFSQYRQTVIDVENAEVDGTATTTFFFNQGVESPIMACPSLGFPVAVTAQLTNPGQITYGNHPGGGTDAGVVGQAEPNGVYTGDSSGTYVTCVAPDGSRFYNYWEGFVQTVGGPAHWDKASTDIVLDGAPTVKVKTK